nr:MAG TPA: hypothetical protein [Bacteriophage sp.]
METFTSEYISDIAKFLEYEKNQDLWHRFI